MHETSFSLLERLRQLADTVAWNRFVELYTPLLYYWDWRAGLQESDAANRFASSSPSAARFSNRKQAMPSGQWRIRADSPGYVQRKDGRDYDADVTRILQRK